MPSVRLDVDARPAEQGFRQFVRGSERSRREATQLAQAMQQVARAMAAIRGGPGVGAQTADLSRQNQALQNQARATSQVADSTRRATAARQDSTRVQQRQLRTALTLLSTLGDENRAFAQRERALIRQREALGQTVNVQERLVRVQERVRNAGGRINETFSTQAVNARDLRLNMAGLRTNVGQLSRSFSVLAFGPLSGVGARLLAVNSLVEETQGGMSRLTKGVIAAGAAFLAVGGFVTAVSRAARSLDDLGKQARAVGVDVEFLQELRFIGLERGVENIDRGLEAFARRLSEARQGTGEARDAFERLGLTLEDLQRLDVESAFREVVERTDETVSGVERAGIAADLFSRRFIRLANVLGETNAELEDSRQRFRELGLIIDRQTVAEAERATNQMDLLKEQLSATALAVFADFTPAFEEMTVQLQEAIVFFADFAQIFADLENQSLRSLRNEIRDLADEIERRRAFQEGRLGTVLGGTAFEQETQALERRAQLLSDVAAAGRLAQEGNEQEIRRRLELLREEREELQAQIDPRREGFERVLGGLIGEQATQARTNLELTTQTISVFESALESLSQADADLGEFRITEESRKARDEIEKTLQSIAQIEEQVAAGRAGGPQAIGRVQAEQEAERLVGSLSDADLARVRQRLDLERAASTQQVTAALADRLQQEEKLESVLQRLLKTEQGVAQATEATTDARQQQLEAFQGQLASQTEQAALLQTEGRERAVVEARLRTFKELAEVEIDRRLELARVAGEQAGALFDLNEERRREQEAQEGLASLLENEAQLRERVAAQAQGGAAAVAEVEALQEARELVGQLSEEQQEAITQGTQLEGLVGDDLVAAVADVIQEQETLNDRLRQSNDAGRAFEEALIQAARNIQTAFADTFLEIFDNGIDGFGGFADRVLDIFKSLAAEIAALLIFRPVVGGVLNATGLSGIAQQLGLAAIGAGGGGGGASGGGIASSLAQTLGLQSVLGGSGGGAGGAGGGGLLGQALGGVFGPIQQGIGSIAQAIGIGGPSPNVTISQPGPGSPSILAPPGNLNVQGSTAAAGLGLLQSLGASVLGFGAGGAIADALGLGDLNGQQSLGGSIGGGVGAVAGAIGGTILGGPLGGGIGAAVGRIIGETAGATFQAVATGQNPFDVQSNSEFRRGIVGAGRGAVLGSTAATFTGLSFLGPVGAIAGALLSIFGGDPSKAEGRLGGPLGSPVGLGDVPSEFADTVAQIDRGISRFLDPDEIARINQRLASRPGLREDFRRFDNEASTLVADRLSRIFEQIAIDAGREDLLRVKGTFGKARLSEAFVVNAFLPAVEQFAEDAGITFDKARKSFFKNPEVSLPRFSEEVQEFLATRRDVTARINQALEPLPPMQTQAEAEFLDTLDEINEGFDELTENAEKFLVAEEELAKIEQGRALAIDRLGQDLLGQVDEQILAIRDPLAVALSDLREEMDGLRRTADELGVSVASIDELERLSAQQIVAQAVGLDPSRDFQAQIDALLNEAQDPLGQALADLGRQFETLRENADLLGISLASINELEAIRARQLIDQQTGLSQTIEQGEQRQEQALPLAEQFRQAQAEFERLRPLAFGGDVQAIGDFVDVAQQLLSLNEQLFASSAERFERDQFILQTLRNLEALLPQNLEGFQTGGSFTLPPSQGFENPVAFRASAGETVTISTGSLEDQVAGVSRTVALSSASEQDELRQLRRELRELRESNERLARTVERLVQRERSVA